MQALIHLVNQQDILSQFQLDYDKLTKGNVQTILKYTYGLTQGYQISYTDADDDQITVQFDEDYQVARLTHEQSRLNLKVKINNDQWVKDFLSKSLKSDSLIVSNEVISSNIQQKQLQSSQKPIQIDLLSGQVPLHQATLNQNTQTQITNIINQINNQQKNQLEKLIVSNEHVPLLIQSKIDQPLQIKQQSSTHQLQVSAIPSQMKRTLTQGSQLQSHDDNSQHKNQPSKLTNLLTIDKKFIQQQNQPQQLEVIQPKIPHKKKQKKKKQTISKPEKKKNTLTEKDIKKLIKKEVFKLLPQISSKLKQFKSQDQNQNTQEIVNQYKQTDYSRLKCTNCCQDLKIPFYINSAQGVKLCQKCESINQESYPLIKIRNLSMLKNNCWIQPLISFTSQTDTKSEIQFYTVLRKQLSDKVKNEFNERIKNAKQKAKMIQRQIKQKSLIQKSQKQIKEQSLI